MVLQRWLREAPKKTENILKHEEDEVDGNDKEEDVSEFDGEVGSEQLMETYYQGLKARKHLRKMGFKGRGKGTGSATSGPPHKKNGVCRGC